TLPSVYTNLLLYSFVIKNLQSFTKRRSSDLAITFNEYMDKIKFLILFTLLMKGVKLMLDHTDMEILDELSKNSRMTMKELGEKVHLTAPATATRVEKLEDSRVIEGFTINVNQAKLGYFVHVFITVMTQGVSHHSYLSFIKAEDNYLINNY